MGRNADHFGGFFAWVKMPTIFLWFFTWVKMPTILGGSSHGSTCRPFLGVLHMDQNADRFGKFFTWVKMPTILGGSSHGSKCRPFWVVLHMGQNADHFGGLFTWVKMPSHDDLVTLAAWCLVMGRQPTQHKIEAAICCQTRHLDLLHRVRWAQFSS